MSDHLTTLTFTLIIDTETGECAGMSLVGDIGPQADTDRKLQALTLIGAAVKIAKLGIAQDAMDTSGRLH